MQNSKTIWAHVDARKDDYEALSDRVWGMPEIAYTEFRSVAEHKTMLEREGFRIKENVAGIPTAVVGEAGEGGPVIAISASTMHFPGCRRWRASRSLARWKPAAMATAADTTCWAPRRC